MTRNEIVAAMQEANLNDKPPHLRDEISKLNPTEAFEILYPIASNTQCDGPAYRAACLLFLVNPVCPITCTDAIRMLLSNWDVSIEEVPWYLAVQFGKDAIRQAIDSFADEQLEHDQIIRLTTIKYWTDIFFTFTVGQLQMTMRRAQRLDG
jgi:hypothetical protein